MYLCPLSGYVYCYSYSGYVAPFKKGVKEGSDGILDLAIEGCVIIELKPDLCYLLQSSPCGDRLTATLKLLRELEHHLFHLFHLFHQFHLFHIFHLHPPRFLTSTTPIASIISSTTILNLFMCSYSAFSYYRDSMHWVTFWQWLQSSESAKVLCWFPLVRFPNPLASGTWLETSSSSPGACSSWLALPL